MRLARIWLCALLTISLLGCAQQSGNERGPLVLAASSLQEALEAAADKWAAEGHERPILSFAGTSSLARQIETGAQADLFISADEKWMDEVARKGLIEPSSRANFLSNRLVLVAPGEVADALQIVPGFELAAEFELAGRLGDGRLAMADPDTVPAGRYGKQALVRLGVWDSVSDRIATAENVRAALALVSRGEAPLGIVYATDALAEPQVAVIGTFPSTSHEPIVYPVVRLKSANHPDAESFRSFLLSDSGKAIFRRFGFAAAD